MHSNRVLCVFPLCSLWFPPARQLEPQRSQRETQRTQRAVHEIY